PLSPIEATGVGTFAARRATIGFSDSKYQARTDPPKLTALTPAENSAFGFVSGRTDYDFDEPRHSTTCNRIWLLVVCKSCSNISRSTRRLKSSRERCLLRSTCRREPTWF